MAAVFAGAAPAEGIHDLRPGGPWPMQGTVPQFLETSMDNFRKNQRQVQEVIETAITSGPFGHLAKQNIEFMRSAREALMPNLVNLTGKKPERDESVAELKQQIAALQAQIDKMAADRAA